MFIEVVLSIEWDFFLLILLQKSFSLHCMFALLETNFHFMLSIYQLDDYMKSKQIIFSSETKRFSYLNPVTVAFMKPGKVE